MDPREVLKQQAILFPDGYDTYKKLEIKSLATDIQLLKNIFNIIATTEIAWANGNFIIDKKLEDALFTFKNHLKTKKLGSMDSTDILLEKAFELYLENYERDLEIHSDLINIKNSFSWQRVIGLIERYLPLNYIQASSDGLSSTLKKKIANSLQGRDLSFVIHCNDRWTKVDFLTFMLAKPTEGLGFDYAIYLESGWVWPDWPDQSDESFIQLRKLKNTKLKDLYNNTNSVDHVKKLVLR
jgi:hypothetical protein